MKKWNYEKKEYEVYSVPADWEVAMYSEDLSEEINCASCGKTVVAGDTYASLKIHSDFGLGFMVCEACYEIELEERTKELKKREQASETNKDLIPLTEPEIKAYLDKCIEHWRKNRESGETALKEMARYYIDAFQSVRVSLFGQTLETPQVSDVTKGAE